MRAKLGGIEVSVWIGWAGGVVLASISGTAVAITFAYGNFESKEAAARQAATTEKTIAEIKDTERERYSELIRRIEMLTAKVDEMRERRR